MLVTVAGTGLTFGMWWVYFIVPQSQLLHARRDLSFRFGYLHLVVFGAIVATGAGLHAAAYYVEHHTKLDSVATVLSVAIPIAVYITAVYLLYASSIHTLDAFNLLLLTVTAAVLVAAVVLVDRAYERAADRHACPRGDRGRVRGARVPPCRRRHHGAFSRLGVG